MSCRPRSLAASMVLIALLAYSPSTSAVGIDNLELPLELLGDVVGRAINAGNTVSSLLGGKRATLLKLFGLVPKQPGMKRASLVLHDPHHGP